MAHICRLSRILESLRNYALCIGVGDSDKQSLVRLAASISNLEIFQIQLKKGDSLIDMKTDLAAMYLKAGLKNVSCMHLMTDSQVAEEIYLVLINELKSFSPPPDIVVKMCAKQDEADAEKKKCQDVADKTAHQIDLAYLFVNGFAIGDSIHSKPSSSHFRLIFCSFHV